MLLGIKSSSKNISRNTAHLYVQSCLLFKATKPIRYSAMAPLGELPNQLSCRVTEITSMNQ